jgi:hypothetical protein
MEIEKQCYGKTGGLQVIDTLRQMLVTQAVHPREIQFAAKIIF